MEKRLYKSNTDKKLDGVCAGIANYFNIDPTLIRLAWVIFTLAGGCGLIAYIIAAIIMPREV
ncbi:MAG: PspC domain-containing protein [Tyzzerella sp.]|jgi:phage shock protein C|nr:PspC domain-containing protein [Tyzzerella sp.]